MRRPRRPPVMCDRCSRGRAPLPAGGGGKEKRELVESYLVYPQRGKFGWVQEEKENSSGW